MRSLPGPTNPAPKTTLASCQPQGPLSHVHLAPTFPSVCVCSCMHVYVFSKHQPPPAQLCYFLAPCLGTCYSLCLEFQQTYLAKLISHSFISLLIFLKHLLCVKLIIPTFMKPTVQYRGQQTFSIESDGKYFRRCRPRSMSQLFNSSIVA